MPDPILNSLFAQRGQFLAFVRRRVADAALAEDLVQAAYVRALEHQHDSQPDESAVAWFYRLLRNAVIDTHRREASRTRALEAWTQELQTSAQVHPDLHGEICACVHGLLDGLKPECSEILRAVDLGDQRVQDFAHQHGLSPSNAGVRIHQARAALRKQLLRTCEACAERVPELHMQTSAVFLESVTGCSL